MATANGAREKVKHTTTTVTMLEWPNQPVYQLDGEGVLRRANADYTCRWTAFVTDAHGENTPSKCTRNIVKGDVHVAVIDDQFTAVRYRLCLSCAMTIGELNP